MEPWYITLLKIIILIPLKLLELVLNIFAFIVWVFVSPIILIVDKIVGDDTPKIEQQDDKG